MDRLAIVAAEANKFRRETLARDDGDDSSVPSTSQLLERRPVRPADGLGGTQADATGNTEISSKILEENRIVMIIRDGKMMRPILMVDQAGLKSQLTYPRSRCDIQAIDPSPLTKISDNGSFIESIVVPTSFQR